MTGNVTRMYILGRPTQQLIHPLLAIHCPAAAPCLLPAQLLQEAPAGQAPPRVVNHPIVYQLGTSSPSRHARPLHAPRCGMQLCTQHNASARDVHAAHIPLHTSCRPLLRSNSSSLLLQPAAPACCYSLLRSNSSSLLLHAATRPR